MATQATNSTIPVLSSWKEIASYLGRGIRTVQRYEQELHLPVRRVTGRTRSSVLALKSDLDVWLNDAPVRFLDPSKELCSVPIISEIRKSMSEHATLRHSAHALRLSHRESVLQLRASLDRVMEQIRLRQSARAGEGP